MMNVVLTSLYLFAIYCIICIIFFHFKGAKKPLEVMRFNFLLITIVYSLYSKSTTGLYLNRLEVVAFTCTFIVFFSYCYFQLFAMLQDSISFKMLTQIYLTKEGGLNKLQEGYSFKKVIESKLEEAVRLGFYTIKDPVKKTYQNTLQGKVTSKAFSSIKKFLKWGKGG